MVNQYDLRGGTAISSIQAEHKHLLRDLIDLGIYNNELKKKSISLEHWRKRFELAIIASKDGLWDIDFKSKKIYFSQAWLNMFGYKENEIKDFSSWFELIHNESMDATQSDIY